MCVISHFTLSTAIDQGLEEPTADVAALISHAAQERLKNFVEKLAVIAEHRMDIIKVVLDLKYFERPHSRLLCMLLTTTL